MITIRNLQLRYGREKVLDGLNLDLHPGSIYGLLGANGSGKSTLLRVLTGALRPHAGDISGQGVTGYVAQKFSLYEDLSVQANIEFRGRCYGIPSSELHLRLESVLDQTGLSSFRRSRTSHLSYGWKQRVALAAALCHRPSLLLLDETTAGIDPGGREVLWSILSDCCRQGATILLTTHHVDEAERCDHVGFLENGRLRFSASPSELRKRGEAETGRNSLSWNETFALALKAR